jgi:pyruvate ferredoxin oxidoreductase beta subunit
VKGDPTSGGRPGGDGGTVDIGMGTLSGMLERNDDVLYICYDNEAYMNTGVQRPGATPPAARPPPPRPWGSILNVGGQEPTRIAWPMTSLTSPPPQWRTFTSEAKATTAMSIRGARYLHVLVPCPLGWGSASNDTINLARLATQSGLFPVFEAHHGEVTSVTKIRSQVPVVDYLKRQRRYGHLFGAEPDVATLERLQQQADRNIARYSLLAADQDEALAAELMAPENVVTAEEVF